MAGILDDQPQIGCPYKVDSKLDLSHVRYFDRIFGISTNGAFLSFRLIFGHTRATLKDWPHVRCWIRVMKQRISEVVDDICALHRIFVTPLRVVA